MLTRRTTSIARLALATGLAACNVETVVETETIPTAGVRFINAVPDTAAMDFRFVDAVENNAHWNIAYRNNVVTSGGTPASTFVQYKAARAGQQRQFRIFMNGGCTVNACNLTYASTIVKDTTVTLVAGSNYTAILMGYANPTRAGNPAGLPAGAPAMRLVFFEETVADPGQNVAIRVINATAAPIDVRYYPSGGAPPATASWASVPALTVSTFLTPTPGDYFYNVQPAGGGAALFADSRALLGAAAQTVAPGPFDAAPGTAVAGSAVTGIVFPRTVAGSPAASVTSPSISFVWDRRPPRAAGT